tara:strand:+ start:82 stop:822 length:741 start_codon:yes stop_codon:yes gene_type:complete
MYLKLGARSMPKVFLVNGCSHTGGGEMEYVKSNCTEYDKHHSYAGHIHRQLFPDYEYVNVSRNGNNNESIALDTLEYLQTINSNDCFVLIGLTDPNRYHYDCDSSFDKTDNRFKFFNSQGLTYKHDSIPYAKELWQGLVALADTDEQQQRTFIKDYTMMVTYFEQHNIDYCMVQTLWFYEKTTRYHKLFEHYFQNPKVLNKNSWKDTMNGWLEQQGYDNSIDGRTGHYREDAHKAWAEHLIKNGFN